MTHLGYILSAWVIVAVAIGVYAWSILQRGRRLAERVDEEQRRWMTSGE